jgi:hypothetical protein
MKWFIGKLMKKSREKHRVEAERERTEHLEWCKRTALKYVDQGDIDTAWTSMYSDLGKRPDTAFHPKINVGMVLWTNGKLSSPEAMRKFINNFE